MTPAQHYREAERLADMVVEHQADGSPPGEYTGVHTPTYRPWIDATLALAQVHATLATADRLFSSGDLSLTDEAAR